MKKVYTLMVAVLVAVTASAQVQVMNASSKMNQKSPFKAIAKKGTLQNTRSISDETWIYYPNWEAAFWGAEVTDGSAIYLKNDSIGLFEYSDGTASAWIHSISQTYDFTSTFFDDMIGEGSMSFKYTPTLNIDSLIITGMYLRDDDYTAVDTLIIGILSYPDAETEGVPSYSFTSYPNTCFIGPDFDPATGVQAEAQIIKVPLTADDQSTPADQEGYYYYAVFELPVNITTTDKIFHVAYTFKSGVNYGLEDICKSHFTAYFAKAADPNYFIDIDNAERCNNLSHGGLVADFTNGSVDYFYPGFAMGQTSSNFAFPEGIRIKVSCTECEVVNVADIEKNNVTVYPNPATDNFTVNLGNDENANIQLFNIVGQQVYSANINGSATINTTSLNSGVYMLKINQNGKVYTSKVIVK